MYLHRLRKPQYTRYMRSLGAIFLDLLEVVVFAIAIFLFVYLLLVRPHKIKGDSMQPNYPNGEYLLTEKVTYYRGDPQRGDVVVLKPPMEDDEFIKRIIGLPGERVSVKNGKVYINGKVLTEKYLSSTLTTPGGNFLPEGQEYTVPEGQYFVMGDNRPNSLDSRGFGPIEKKAIAGRAWLIYWPLNRIGLTPSVSY